MEPGIKKYIGSRSFYRTVLAVAVPIIIQNGITQFVGVLDNIMIGRLGTEPMSGVAIANQLFFVFNLAIFGGLSGAGIFGAQFAGKKDNDGIRSVLRFKLLICAAISAAALLVFALFCTPLLKLFLHDGSAEGDLEFTLVCAKQYLYIILIGIIPQALAQCYASTLRETGETLVPMIGSGTAVIINLVLNYVLIFGKFGMPALGVRGAAAATVISRFAEFLIMVIWSHRHTERFPFFKGVYRSFAIPGALMKDIIKKGFPLLFNEFMWSVGIALLAQSYSTRGLSIVAAYNISSTVTHLFNIAFMSIGSSIGIIVGNLLGANKLEEAKDTDRKIIALSLAACAVFGLLLIVAAPYIPRLYNTGDEVRRLATGFLMISALMAPFQAFTHACYFTLRSGGQTKITLLFDSCYVWVVCIPVAFVLSRFTNMHILPLFAIVSSLEIVKCIFGYILVKSGKWVVNIVK